MKTKQKQDCISLCSQSAKWSSHLALQPRFFLIQLDLVCIYPEILNLGLNIDGLILFYSLTVAVATTSGTSWLTGIHCLSLIERTSWLGEYWEHMDSFSSHFLKWDCLLFSYWDLLYSPYSFSTYLHNIKILAIPFSRNEQNEGLDLIS